MSHPKLALLCKLWFENMSARHNDIIAYPQLTQKRGGNKNNPFLLYSESNALQNYTNPNNEEPKQIKMPNMKSLSFSSMFIDRGFASNISTSFNIIKGIMGVGLLTIPWCIDTVGLLPSLILMTISFLLSYICWILLSLLCDKYHVYTYRDVGLITFGEKFAICLYVILFVFLYLVCILYVVFLSQFIQDGLSEFGIIIDDNITFGNLQTLSTFEQFAETKFFIITISIFFILFPLSLLPNLDSLKYSSFIGIIGCFYTIGLIVFTFFDEKDKNGYYVSKSVKFWANFHLDSSASFIWYWLSAFSVFVACFNTHYNCPALYGELQDKTPSKYINIASISFILVLFINLLIGICGYFAFGDASDENILDTLNHGIIVGTARLIMALTIIGSYPLLFSPIKESIDNLVLYRNITNENHTKIKKMPRKYTCPCSKIFIYFLGIDYIYVSIIIYKQ